MEVVKLRNRLLNTTLRTAIDEFAAESRRTGVSTLPHANTSGPELEHLALTDLATFTEHAERTMNLLGQSLRGELEWTPASR